MKDRSTEEGKITSITEKRIEFWEKCMAPNFTFKISYSPSPIAKFYKKGVKFLCIWLLNLCKDFAQSLPISLGSGTESLRILLYCFTCLYYQVPDPIPGFQLNP